MADFFAEAVADGANIADDVTITMGNIIETETWVVVGDGVEAGAWLEAFATDILAEVAEGEAALVIAILAVAVVIKAEVVVIALVETSEVGSWVTNIIETEVIRVLCDGSKAEIIVTEHVSSAE